MSKKRKRKKRMKHTKKINKKFGNDGNFILNLKKKYVSMCRNLWKVGIGFVPIVSNFNQYKSCTTVRVILPLEQKKGN